MNACLYTENFHHATMIAAIIPHSMYIKREIYDYGIVTYLYAFIFICGILVDRWSCLFAVATFQKHKRVDVLMTSLKTITFAVATKVVDLRGWPGWQFSCNASAEGYNYNITNERIQIAPPLTTHPLSELRKNLTYNNISTSTIYLNCFDEG